MESSLTYIMELVFLCLVSGIAGVMVAAICFKLLEVVSERWF